MKRLYTTKSDLISRKAAIDSIEKHLRFGDELYPLTDTDKILNHGFEIAASCVYNLPSAQAEHGRWIPCSERLPEIGDTYIVTGIQKDPHEKEWHYFVDVASNYGDYIDDYWDTFNDWIEGQETHIVAWMPLPEPYKMGGNENER